MKYEKRGLAYSLARNLVHSVPLIERTGTPGRTDKEIATSIFAKALCWWNLDENGGAPLGVPNRAGPNYGYVWGGGPPDGASIVQPTIRSGGLASFGFTTVSRCLFSAADHTYIAELVGAPSYSVVAWCKPNAATSAGYRTIVDDGGATGSASSNSQYHFAILPDGRPTLLWQNGNNVNQNATANPLHVVANTPYFFGADKTVATRNISYYTNGVLAASQTYPAGTEPTGGAGGGQQQVLGATYQLLAGTTSPFDGLLQDVAIFKPALVADEHAFLYNGGVGRSLREIKEIMNGFSPGTVLLMHLNGTNGSAVFTDFRGAVFTGDGNGTITTAQSKFGGASLNSYIHGPPIGEYDFGIGDFTMELWVWPRTLTATLQALLSNRPSVVGWGGGFNLLMDNTGWSCRFFDKSSASIFMGAAPLTLNAWNHVAICRQGNTWTGYTNGVGGTPVIDPMRIGLGSEFYIGRDAVPGTPRTSDSYIDEVRITKGIAIYTGNFTPPVAAFPNA